MIRKCAVLICSYMEQKTVIDSTDREVYQYGLECLMATHIQNLLLLVLAAVLHILPQTVIFALSFGAVKRWAGGFHAGSHVSCVGISTTLTLGMAALAKIIPVTPFLHFCVIISRSAALAKSAGATPQQSQNRATACVLPAQGIVNLPDSNGLNRTFVKHFPNVVFGWCFRNALRVTSPSPTNFINIGGLSMKTSPRLLKAIKQALLLLQNMESSDFVSLMSVLKRYHKNANRSDVE